MRNVLVEGSEIMYCKECGSLIKRQGRKVPECCKVCGAKFEIIPNPGMNICVIVTIVLMIPVILILKRMLLNEKLIYVIGLTLLIVILNIAESILLRLGIIQYTNLKL